MNELKYQNLKYKIFLKSDDEVKKVIKPLETRYSAFRRLIEHAGSAYLPTVKYLFYLYDPQTDLNREYVRLEDRKNQAAKDSGLDKHEALYSDIFDQQVSEVLDVIQILLTEVYHDIDYREWQTLHNELDEYTSARWDRIESSRRKNKDGEEISRQDKSSIEALNLKSKLREDCKRIRELIAELDLKIFGDDKNLKEIAYMSRYTSPESFSRAARLKI